MHATHRTLKSIDVSGGISWIAKSGARRKKEASRLGLLGSDEKSQSFKIDYV